MKKRNVTNIVTCYDSYLFSKTPKPLNNKIKIK